MQTLPLQAAPAVVMIRPHRFHANPQTAADNGYQACVDDLDPAAVAAAARDEVTRAAERLRREGVAVHLFEDDGTRGTPDSVFPNNWFSTHADGTLALYPMHAPNRRAERRDDVLAALERDYLVRRRLDLTAHERDGRALEGTGAMVLDHAHRVAYLARSRRGDEGLFRRWCAELGFAPVAFDTDDGHGRPVYHGNVLMSIAARFALVGFELIARAEDRTRVRVRLLETGHALVELSAAQIADFCANALELATPDGPVLALSTRAAASLTAAQRAVIEACGTRLVALDVPTIERAGGSVRCMLAGVHLRPK